MSNKALKFKFESFLEHPKGRVFDEHPDDVLRWGFQMNHLDE